MSHLWRRRTLASHTHPTGRSYQAMSFRLACRPLAGPSRSVLTSPVLRLGARARPFSTPSTPPTPPSRPTPPRPGTGPSGAAAAAAARDRLYAERMKKNRTMMLYVVGALALATGITYAAVPAYRAFCAATGYAGTPMTDPARFEPSRLYADAHTKRRPITVRFEATSSDTLPWSFEPLQRSVKVVPGETALAFYTATNNSDKDLIGIATYNMTPDKIAPYFAKVECFCFEEQKIRAGEEIDLPVFFFIDRDMVDDPTLDDVDDVILSYTFFRAKRNDMGHAVFDASADEVNKASGWDKYEHAPANPEAKPA